MITYKYLGITDDVTTCDCCGRTRLQRTVEIEICGDDGTDSGIVHYGTSCAAKAIAGAYKTDAGHGKKILERAMAKHAELQADPLATVRKTREWYRMSFAVRAMNFASPHTTIPQTPEHLAALWECAIEASAAVAPLVARALNDKAIRI